MKKVITIISMIALTGCDGGWQGQIDSRDDKIIILTKENCQLKKSYDSLNLDYHKYIRQQIDVINQMVEGHNKCVHGSSIK